LELASIVFNHLQKDKGLFVYQLDQIESPSFKSADNDTLSNRGVK